MNRALRIAIAAVCIGGTIFGLSNWHGAWTSLQDHLATGDYCLDLAVFEDDVAAAETTALGFAGITFAVLPIVLFSESTADLLSLLFIIVSTYLGFAPAGWKPGLEGAHRVAAVVTLGVIAMLVIVIAHLFRRATAADAKSSPPPGRDRGYLERLWQTWPLIVLAAGTIVFVAVATPLLRPFSSTNEVAVATVKQHLSDLQKDADTTMCGGGRTEPEPGPSKG